MNAHSENPPVVLVVKDDRDVLDLLIDLLQTEGYKIFSAESAQRALEIIAGVCPDIVLSDVMMPGMNGVELCSTLKNDPKTSAIPVLLVSAVRKEEAELLEGYVAGADDYLEI